MLEQGDRDRFDAACRDLATRAGGQVRPVVLPIGDAVVVAGLTLRDHIAISVAAAVEGNPGANDWSAEKLAGHAYAVADAMLKRRAESPA